MDREAALEVIVEHGRQTRKRLPRWLWIAALIVSVVCVGALAIGLIEGGSDDHRASVGSGAAVASGTGSGLGVGLMIGIGVGIAIGAVLATKRKR